MRKLVVSSDDAKHTCQQEEEERPPSQLRQPKHVVRFGQTIFVYAEFVMGEVPPSFVGVVLTAGCSYRRLFVRRVEITTQMILHAQFLYK